MNNWYVSCRKDTENIDPKIVRTKNDGLVMQCLICGVKKSRFISKKWLSNSWVKTTLSKILLLNVLLNVYENEWNCQ